ncbi:MAG: transporter substrate-binding domain-containing protein [Filomicrobium sp.]
MSFNNSMTVFKTLALAAALVGSSTLGQSADASRLKLQGAEKAANSPTVHQIISRNRLRCGVTGEFVGMSIQQPGQAWEGLDVDFCRAVAVSIFGLPPFLFARGGGNLAFQMMSIRHSIDDKIEFKPTQTRDRLDLLASGFVDILFRSTTKTSARDTQYFALGAGSKLEFGPVVYYDGQAIVVRLSPGTGAKAEAEKKAYLNLQRNRLLDPRGKEAREAEQAYIRKYLAGKTICVQSNTTSLVNLRDYIERNRFDGDAKPTIREVATANEARNDFFNPIGTCTAITGDFSQLVGLQEAFASQVADVFFLHDGTISPMMSKEPLAPVLREGDGLWADIVEWTVYGIIRAEEIGLDQAKALRILQTYNRAYDDFGRGQYTFEASQLTRSMQTDLLKYAGIQASAASVADTFGLRRTWLLEIVASIGNYGEVYERAFAFRRGPGDKNLDHLRGLNALWNASPPGLHYAPPFKTR